MISTSKNKREIATKIKDKMVRFETCHQESGNVQKRCSGVRERIQMFEEKTPISDVNKKSHGAIAKDKTRCDSGGGKSEVKMPRFPPPLVTVERNQVQRHSVVIKTSSPEPPRLPEDLTDSSEIVLQRDDADLNSEIACKPLWKGREYLKQLSTEELINNLRIIEKLRDSYIEEIKETAHSPTAEKDLHDIAIYREEAASNPFDEEFGLSELHENEDSYIVEAYNAVGSELVISQLQFDHHEEIAFENATYTSAKNLAVINNHEPENELETKINDFITENQWQSKNNGVDYDLRSSQYSESNSEDSTYMSLRDCLSGTTLLYENTRALETTSAPNYKGKNLKIKIDVVLDGDDDEDEQKCVPSEKKDYLIEELINTEEKYISDLKIIVKHYMPYLHKANLPDHLKGKQHILFGNIIEIYTESKNFLAALKTCGYDHEKIAETFLNFRLLFQLYPLYSKNKPKADIYLPEFRVHARGKQEELGERLDLGSYLLAPIQRLGKYILLLKGINDQLNKRYSHSITVQAALDMIKEAMSRANDYIAIDSIKDCPINLSKAGSFVMREKFMIRANKTERTFESMVFFFDGIIVFTIESYKDKEVFAYIDSIKMTDLILVPLQNEPLTIKLENYSKTKRSSPKPKNQCIYVLEAKSPRIKQFWTENIEKRLWEQMNKWKEEVNAQYSKGEVSPVLQQNNTNRPKVERAKTLPERARRRTEKKKSSTFYIKLG